MIITKENFEPKKRPKKSIIDKLWKYTKDAALKGGVVLPEDVKFEWSWPKPKLSLAGDGPIEVGKAMHEWAEKHWSPFPVIKVGEGTGLRMKDCLSGLSIGFKELETTHKLNVIDHDGTPVNLEDCKVEVVDAVKGIIEIKTYKRKKKW